MDDFERQRAKDREVEQEITGPSPGTALLAAYIDRLRQGGLPQLIPQGELDGFEVGPELVTVVGAPPGAGKTALASQIMFDGLERDESLIAYVCNAEMNFEALMRRELTRATRIKSEYLRFGVLDAHDLERIDQAAKGIAGKLERTRFYVDSVDMTSLADLLDRPPGLVVIDYLQKFSPPDKEARQGVNVVMAVLRKLANHGHAVLALSATKRDAKGKHSAGELDLSSFRESGEVEYNADSAYVMADQGPVNEDTSWLRSVMLKHVKNRHGAKVDHDLTFNMPLMEFTKAEIDGFDPDLGAFSGAANDDGNGFCYGGDQ